MKQIFLTSSAHLVAKHIASKLDLQENNKLAFIDTASELETDDKQWLTNDRNALIKAGFEVSDYTITNKTKDELKKDLQNFDYIYLSGGNTTYLLQQSQKSGFIELINDNQFTKYKTYVGTSAGSIIAGPKVPTYLFEENKDLSLNNYEGYNLVNFTILPHWGSDGFKELYLEGRLKVTYSETQNPLITLTDTQYIYISNGQTQLFDVNKE